MGGAAGAGGTSGAGGVCAPGEAVPCYDGPAGTADVGACLTGSRTCDPDGTLGACLGQVLPSPEDPATPADDDCDGVPSGGVVRRVVLGGPGEQTVLALAVDEASGRVFVAGLFSDELRVGGAVQATTPGPGLRDVFVLALEPNGALAWLETFGDAGGGDDGAWLTLEPNPATGSLLLAGGTSADIPLANDLPGAFVASLDPSNGEPSWVIGCSGGTFKDLAVDPGTGRAVAVGHFTVPSFACGWDSLAQAQGEGVAAIIDTATGQVTWNDVFTERARVAEALPSPSGLTFDFAVGGHGHCFHAPSSCSAQPNGGVIGVADEDDPAKGTVWASYWADGAGVPTSVHWGDLRRADTAVAGVGTIGGSVVLGGLSVSCAAPVAPCGFHARFDAATGAVVDLVQLQHGMPTGLAIGASGAHYVVASAIGVMSFGAQPFQGPGVAVGALLPGSGEAWSRLFGGDTPTPKALFSDEPPPRVAVGPDAVVVTTPFATLDLDEDGDDDLVADGATDSVVLWLEP